MTALAGLAALFFLTALAYAMVGFGGGSTYTALLVLADTDYRILPAISLACNITVVTGSVIQYGLSGLIRWKRLLPLAALSVPMAWLGGRMEIPERLFITLLGLALLASAAALVFRRPTPGGQPEHLPVWSGPALGGGIGFLAGLVGIGGGIFLAPVLHFLRWGPAREIAAAASVFILVNSVAGLGGQIQRLSASGDLGAVISYWPLLPAVLIGGQIGVWLGRTRTSETWLIRLTALLVLFVSVRLLWRASGL
ncbi:sulfite exporter TauE/SafE family protein [Hyphobacterium indicum]|uniref:sulfite exporter TauE/SafE family protein n=1 Tax=Hyphobacterium indicum TaxID=2162714 RepID=UPI000D644993|nr:sulfite exporter TauE/SafE family protein [Hyphobacterium indicum]